MITGGKKRNGVLLGLNEIEKERKSQKERKKEKERKKRCVARIKLNRKKKERERKGVLD